MVDFLGIRINRSKPKSDRIAKADEELALLDRQIAAASKKGKLAGLDMVPVLVAQVAQSDPVLALAIVQGGKKNALADLATSRLPNPEQKSAMQQVLEQVQAMRALQDALLLEAAAEVVEAPDDTPGWLVGLNSGPIGEAIGSLIGAVGEKVVREGLPGPKGQSQEEPAQLPPPSDESRGADGAGELPPPTFLQRKVLLSMLERRTPEEMAQAVVEKASDIPALVGLVNAILLVSDEEVMPFLAKVGTARGWQEILGWLGAHRDYTLAMVATLRVLVAQIRAEAAAAGTDEEA